MLPALPAYRIPSLGHYTVESYALTFRKQPDSTAKAITILAQGQDVTVLQIFDTGWANVHLLDGADGYVFLKYLRKAGE